MGSDPNKVITVAVNGVKNFLEAAAKHPSVKRVVLTSSSSAALIPPLNKKIIVDIGKYPRYLSILRPRADHHF